MTNGEKRYKRIYVEISNVCNLQCSFCPEVAREKHFMAPELFSRVIDQIAPLTEEVCFHLMGEPLAHPRFADYVALCSEKKLPVHLTTNGTLLSGARADAALNPVVRQVNISLQSFEANFPRKDMSAYLEKVFRFAARALAERPDLYVNFRLWNLKDSPDLEMPKAGGAPGEKETNEIIFEKLKAFFGTEFDARVDVRRRKNVQIKGRLYLHFDSRFQWPHPSSPVRSNTGFCHGLSSHFGIHADGTVVPCCLDKEAVIRLGNVTEAQLEEVIDGARATRMKTGFAEGKLVEDLCRRCTFISRFDKKARRSSADRGVDAADVVVGV